MSQETLHYDPSRFPEISSQIELDVPLELVEDFKNKFDQLLDEQGVDGTINDATESYEGRKYTRYNKDNDMLFISRRAQTNELTALLQTQTNEGAPHWEVYRLDENGLLTYKEPGKLVAKPGTFRLVGPDDTTSRRAEVGRWHLPPSPEVQEMMLTDFMQRSDDFTTTEAEMEQPKKVGVLRAFGRRALGRH